MTDGQAQKQLFFACKFFIAAIARINIKRCKGPLTPLDFPKYGFCNYKTLSDPPWYMRFTLEKTVSAHEHVYV